MSDTTGRESPEGSTNGNDGSDSIYRPGSRVQVAPTDRVTRSGTLPAGGHISLLVDNGDQEVRVINKPRCLGAQHIADEPVRGAQSLRLQGEAIVGTVVKGRGWAKHILLLTLLMITSCQASKVTQVHQRKDDQLGDTLKTLPQHVMPSSQGHPVSQLNITNKANCNTGVSRFGELSGLTGDQREVKHSNKGINWGSNLATRRQMYKHTMGVSVCKQWVSMVILANMVRAAPSNAQYGGVPKHLFPNTDSFTVYDCSGQIEAPTLHKYSLGQPEACKNVSTRYKIPKTARVQMLQIADTTIVPVTRCLLKYRVLVGYCGTSGVHNFMHAFKNRNFTNSVSQSN